MVSIIKNSCFLPLSFELANTSTRCFSIDRYTGAFYATGDPAASKDLDREIIPVIRLRVLVRDRVSSSLGMSQQRFGEGWINVHLEDINDHDPEFIGLLYHTTFCVKEHSLTSDPPQFNGLTTPASHVLSQLQEACQSNFFKVRFLLINYIETSFLGYYFNRFNRRNLVKAIVRNS